jgi:hypothetical protein
VTESGMVLMALLDGCTLDLMPVKFRQNKIHEKSEKIDHCQSVLDLVFSFLVKKQPILVFITLPLTKEKYKITVTYQVTASNHNLGNYQGTIILKYGNNIDIIQLDCQCMTHLQGIFLVTIFGYQI